MNQLFFVLFLPSVIIGQYIPHQPKVLPLYPKGLQLSIPDEQGISLVAYHIKFNEDFDGLEAGTIAKDIVVARKGHWTLLDRNVRMKFGDTIYYWVHVVYNGLGYNLLDQQHIVTAFYDTHGVEVVTNAGGNENTASNCSDSITKLVDMHDGTFKNTCPGDVLLYEEFSSLNRSLWRCVEKFSKAPEYPFVAYRDRDQNVRVENGKLIITPTMTEHELNRTYIRSGYLTLDKCTGLVGSVECQRQGYGPFILPPVMSGYVDTKNTFAFLYGIIEVRAKLPRGDWIYPIISLEPMENAKNTSYPQLRVAQSSGNSVLRSTLGADISGHLLTGGGTLRNDPHDPRILAKRFNKSYWSDDYHVYRLKWTNNKISVMVDGVEYGYTESGSPFDRPFYIVLGVGVGGYKQFPDMSESNGYVKPWQNTGYKAAFDFYNATDLWAQTWENDAKDLKIDYVKVLAV